MLFFGKVVFRVSSLCWGLNTSSKGIINNRFRTIIRGACLWKIFCLFFKKVPEAYQSSLKCFNITDEKFNSDLPGPIMLGF